MTRLTTTQRGELAAALAAGDRYTDIAARFGIHPNTVTYHARNLGYGPRNSARQVVTQTSVEMPTRPALEVRGTPPWMEAGACRGVDDPDLFYPQYERHTAAAKAICETCPVRETCRAWALARREPHGVWGGLSELERRHLLSEEAGVQMRPARPRNGSDVSTDRIVELHEQGLSLKEIAEQVGLSDVTIGSRLRSRGIRIGRGHQAVFDEDYALQLAQSGMSAAAVARAVGVCRQTIVDRLATRGHTFTSRHQPADVQAMIRLAEQGLFKAAIARELGVDERTVTTHLRRAGVTPADGRDTATNLPREDVTADALAADYRAGMTIPAIAAKWATATATVRRRLKTVTDLEWRDDRSTCGGANRTTPQVEADIAARYTSGATGPDIAAALGLPVSTVHGVLDRTGVPMRTPGESQRGRPGVDGAAGLKELMRSNGVTSADVRAWARGTGRAVPPNGIPCRHLVEDYLLHHRRNHEEERHTA